MPVKKITLPKEFKAPRRTPADERAQKLGEILGLIVTPYRHELNQEYLNHYLRSNILLLHFTYNDEVYLVQYKPKEIYGNITFMTSATIPDALLMDIERHLKSKLGDNLDSCFYSIYIRKG